MTNLAVLRLVKNDVTDYRELPIPVISRFECVVDSLPELITRVAKIARRHEFDVELRGADALDTEKAVAEVIEENVNVILEMKGLTEADRGDLTARILEAMDEIREEVNREIAVVLRRANRLEQDAEEKRRDEQSKADQSRFMEKISRKRNPFKSRKKRMSRKG